MGKVSRGVPCSVNGCDEKAERSVSKEKVAKSGLKISSRSSRVYLCKKHWKEYKRLTKKDRKIEKWMWRGRLT